MLILFIEVLRKDEGDKDEGGLKAGTFKLPFPWLKVALGTSVQWKIKHGHHEDKFRIVFPNGSPFPNRTEVDECTEALTATISGVFSYQVFVTDGMTGTVYKIDRSPIFDTDP
jgi:hypothetical protein